MRILAIRGHNIASLSERFEIDLTAPPLAGTGLFAITGDTGAGKSTILDALCLALYGDYPRAVAHKGEKVVDPSAQRLEASDPRNILRRGAGQGWAEVDFIGQDGVGYRARWEVRRAGGRADGNPQKPDRVLQRLDGEGVVASSIKEVEAAVVARSGFTFDQFRRSVLLAQGEFDAFLLASEPARAELLEKITGTEIYSRISQHVFEMTGDRNWRLAELERQREAVGVLADEARGALLQEQEQARLTVATEETACGALAAELKRADDIAADRASLAEAEAAFAAATTAWTAASEDRDLVLRLSAVAPLRALVDGLAKLEAERVAGGAAAEAAVQAVVEAERRAASAREASTTLEHAVREAVDASVAAEPLLQHAAELDAQVVAARHDLDAAQRAAAEARDAATKLERVSASGESDLEEVEQRLEATRGALSERAGHAPLAQDLAHVVRLLGTRNELSARARAEAAEVSGLAEVEKTNAGRIAMADARRAEQQAERRALAADLDQRRAALAELDEAGLELRADLVRGARDVAQAALDAACRRDAGSVATSAARSSLEQAASQRIESLARVEQAEAERQRRAAERVEAGRMAELAEATLSAHAARLRGALIDGEACPVCGSNAHPYGHDGSAGGDMAHAIRARRAELDAELTRLDTVIVDAKGAVAEAEARQAATSRELAAGEAAIREALRGLRGAMVQLRELMPRLDVGSRGLGRDVAAVLASDEPEVSAFSELVARIDAERATLAGPRQRAAALRQSAEDLQGRLDVVANAITTGDESTRADRALLQQTQVALARAQALQHDASTRLAQVREALAPYLTAAGLDTADLDRDPESARERLQGLAKDYASFVATERDLVDRQRALAGTTELARDRLQAGMSVRDRTAELARERDELLARLLAERAGLLGGAETGAYRRQLREREMAARQGLEEARDALAAAEVAVSRAMAERVAAARRSDEFAAREAEAVAGWAVALIRAGVAEPEARSLLAEPPERIVELSSQLAAIDSERVRAETLQRSRRKDLDERLASGGDLDAARREDLGSQLVARRAGLDASKARLAVIANDLERDDTARRKVDIVGRDIAALRQELAVWQTVNDAIGQKDGAKFRRFAQGVTLGQLVALANEQLAALNPRYRLRASAVSYLSFDVLDRDMSEEVRSPRSLSGGERFLVSLALALALSRLEGRQSFVDTLFIDEGFGSLDRDTLDIAIDALEALQGHGRKVGVITHVPAMIERIAVQIRVDKRGGGRSVVRVRDGAEPATALAS